ncbi:2461_t:CDS:2, partial [Funneliformis caledonium]
KGSDPPIEFFLPNDNEYDSEETLDLFEYDLVKILDEEQNETLSSDIEMEKDDDVLLEEEYNDDIIICDDINNLQKIRENLRNKLHANKYFMEEIIPKLVLCKCGKKIWLDRDFRDKNLTTHDELSNCKYSGKGQQSIKVFFKPKKSKNEDENIIVKKVPCKGLCEEKYRKYVFNSPAEFGGSVRLDIAARELFLKLLKQNLD